MVMQLRRFTLLSKLKRATFLDHGFVQNVRKSQQMDVKWWSVNLAANGTTLLALDLQKISRHRGAAANVTQPCMKFPLGFLTL
ncbi:hypothetical protein E2C01_063681 [Portunus trituberculatus]|uniref:Uncharacterized protein n=1 Tax=Portunus trituberculatus TaxID=210409 RepID=A0A5B7HHQ5_PORTR|nr:hypothetical protein [Portunus trituberculatus]